MTDQNFSDNPRVRKVMRRVRRAGLWTLAGIGFAVVFVAVLGFLLQLLWNATLVPIFEISTISFWQALGLFVLAKFLFGFGAGSSGIRRGRHRRHRRGKDSDTDKPADADLSPGDDERFVDDDAFRRFWREEGRAAYETYRRTGGDEGQSEVTPQ